MYSKTYGVFFTFGFYANRIKKFNSFLSKTLKIVKFIGMHTIQDYGF